MIKYDNYSRVLELSRLPPPEQIVEPEKPSERLTKNRWNSWCIERYSEYSDVWTRVTKYYDTKKQAENVLTNRDIFFKRLADCVEL